MVNPKKTVPVRGMIQPTSSSNIENNIYKDLIKLNFDGLIKKDFKKDELNVKLNKLLNSFNNDSGAINEIINRRKAISKVIKSNSNNDNNDYPFKEEKITCSIF